VELLEDMEGGLKILNYYLADCKSARAVRRDDDCKP